LNPNSYGFRVGRSCHDAIEAIWISINKSQNMCLTLTYLNVLTASTMKLLTKLRPHHSPSNTSMVKSRVMDSGQLFPTSEGTQGGVISPLLANIALHGMEERIKQFAETLKVTSTTIAVALA